MKMDTRNFQLQSSLEANYLHVPLRDAAWLDEIAIKVIKEDCPDFLIPFRLLTINDVQTFRYRLTNMTALSYINMSMKKSEFLLLYGSLLAPFIKGVDWFLDYHYLCIDPAYVYISRNLQKAYYIYLPEMSAKNPEEKILSFFREILYRVSIVDDKEFLLQLYQYFNKGQITLFGLYDILLTESRPKARPKWQTQEAEGQNETVSTDPVSAQGLPFARESQDGGETAQGETVYGKEAAEGTVAEQKERKKRFPGFGGNRQEKKKSEETPVLEASGQSTEPTDEEEEVMNILFGDSGRKKTREKKKKEKPEKAKSSKEKGTTERSGFGLFGAKKEKERRPVKNSEREIKTTTGSLQGAFVSGRQHAIMPTVEETEIGFGDFEETEVVGAAGFGQTGCLELTESAVAGAPQRIALDFAGSFITIGRMCSDTTRADIQFDRAFSKMSRMHARIERKGSEFYVIDLGSANYTLLDGQRLIPNQPYPLQDGAELTFTMSQPVRYRVLLR